MEGEESSAARTGRLHLDHPPVCENVYQVECGQCKTVFQKVCSIEMQERVVERTVRRCKKYRNRNCKDGYRRKCRTRWTVKQESKIILKLNFLCSTASPPNAPL